MKKFVLLTAFFAVFALVFIACPTDSDPKPTMYNVTFDMQGRADDLPTESVEKGNTVTKPADPTSEKYDFVHWYTSSADYDGGYDFDTPVTGDLILIAKWTVKAGTSSFTVTFFAGEDVEVPPPQEVASEDFVSKPLVDPVKEGYTFMFWYDASEVVEVEFAFESTPITKNITITAKWEDDSSGPWIWSTFDDKKETGGNSDVTLKKEKDADGETVYSVTGTIKTSGYAYPFAGLIAAVNPNHPDYEANLAALRSAKSFSFWITGNQSYITKLPQNSLKGKNELIDPNDPEKGYGTMDASHYQTTAAPRADGYREAVVQGHDDLTLRPSLTEPQHITLKIGVAEAGGGGGDFVQPAWASSAAKNVPFNQNELEQINWQTNSLSAVTQFEFKIWGLELHQE